MPDVSRVLPGTPRIRAGSAPTYSSREQHPVPESDRYGTIEQYLGPQSNARLHTGGAVPKTLCSTIARPFPSEEMKSWKVGKAVGNARNDDPSLIEPLKNE